VTQHLTPIYERFKDEMDGGFRMFAMWSRTLAHDMAVLIWYACSFQGLSPLVKLQLAMTPEITFNTELVGRGRRFIFAHVLDEYEAVGAALQKLSNVMTMGGTAVTITTTAEECLAVILCHYPQTQLSLADESNPSSSFFAESGLMVGGLRWAGVPPTPSGVFLSAQSLMGEESMPTLKPGGNIPDVFHLLYGQEPVF
jgi:hypothetical protein